MFENMGIKRKELSQCQYYIARLRCKIISNSHKHNVKGWANMKKKMKISLYQIKDEK